MREDARWLIDPMKRPKIVPLQPFWKQAISARGLQNPTDARGSATAMGPNSQAPDGHPASQLVKSHGQIDHDLTLPRP